MGGERPDPVKPKDESFISLDEASKVLEMSLDEVQVLIRDHKLVAFQLGDQLLRLRKDQVWELQSKKRISAELFPDERAKPARVPIEMKSSMADTVRDFFYFNDFYIVSTVVITALLYLILSSQV